jgi:L-gulonolactone oxidase
MGSVSDITLGGAINVATHGSSIHHKVISGYILEFELLSSSGDIHRCSEEENPEIYRSALCGLGSIGILINVTIQCEQSFLLHQFGYVTSVHDFVDNIHDFLDTHYAKINWYPHTNRVLVLNSTKVYDVAPTKFSLPERMYQWIVYKALGHYCYEFCLWISTFYPPLTTWINRFFFTIVHSQFVEKIDHSYKVMEMDCLFSQHVNEWAIPVEKAGLAMLELIQLIESPANQIYAHFPIEIRFTAQDQIYLSPSFGRDTCYVNVIMYRPYGKEIPYRHYWDEFESIMKRNDGRPHWAKVSR